MAVLRRGQIRYGQARIRKIKHGNRCLTSGRSLGWLGATSGGLDGWHGGRGTPAKPSDESRARERVGLREMGQGIKCGCGGAQKGAGRRRRLDTVHSGCSTLSIVKQGDLVVVANVGDSRVVLGTAFDDNTITSSNSSST
uniref:protein-serine/threonine phosphatase n=1 Tax=Zea mays TaxID=4577 RepID=A0A804NFS6_MAIZE